MLYSLSKVAKAVGRWELPSITRPVVRAIPSAHQNRAHQNCAQQNRVHQNRAHQNRANQRQDLPHFQAAKSDSPGNGNSIYVPFHQRRLTSQNAFTLLEVIIGLILMATVLVGSMLSYSAHQRQLAVADKRIAAVSFADDVLAQLTGGGKNLPRAMRGVIPAKPNWYWQTSVVGTTAPMEVPMAVVRLQVIEVKPDGSSLVLTSVDLVEPIE